MALPLDGGKPCNAIAYESFIGVINDKSYRFRNIVTHSGQISLLPLPSLSYCVSRLTCCMRENIHLYFPSPRPICSSALPRYQAVLPCNSWVHFAMLHAYCSCIGLAYFACTLQSGPTTDARYCRYSMTVLYTL